MSECLCELKLKGKHKSTSSAKFRTIHITFTHICIINAFVCLTVSKVVAFTLFCVCWVFVCLLFFYHVIGVQYFAQQLRHNTLSFHGGIGLAQVHSYPQRSLAVHQPCRHRQDTLLHVGCRGQTTELLEGHHCILGRKHPHKKIGIWL